jgi:hypothetical protein
VSRDPYDPALTLRVAATLAALGVPPRQGLQLVKHMIQDHRGPGALLDLPTEVQEGMARGATPGEAADGLERGEGEARGNSAEHRQDGEHRHPRKP